MADVESDVHDIWAHAVERTKQATVNPSLYRALDRTVAIAFENGTFVVGLDSADGLLISTINTGENQLQIEKVLRQTLGDSSIRFRLIEGITPGDWEKAKARDAAMVETRTRQAERQKVIDPNAIMTWDTLYDQLARIWATFEYRNMASGKGRFLQTVFDTVEKSSLGEPNEQTERAFSRLLERVGSMTGSDPVVLAYLFHERRRER